MAPSTVAPGARPTDESSQRGEGRLGFVLTLAVVGALAFVGFKVIPVRIHAYQFRDTLREEVRYASVNHRDDSAIRKRILDQAAALNIPLDPENLRIERSRKEVVISARYVHPVDLKVTTYNYNFDEKQRAPIF